MRAALLALVLAVVLALSALNLALGAGWLIALAGIGAARRRVRLAPFLVLGLVAGLGMVGRPRGWLDPPPAASYEQDELDWLRRLTARTASPAPDARLTLANRLAALQDEERLTVPTEVERRAGAAVTLARAAAAVRGRAPGEVATLEAAVRRLAFTLTSPEFRDLDARKAQGERLLAELNRRLSLAADGAELAAISRALDPVALAPVSLRAVREDLARVETASRALIQALGGGSVTAVSTTTVGLDDAGDQAATETRYRLEVAPPTLIVRLDLEALGRPSGRGSRAGRLHVEVDGRPAVPVAALRDVVLDPGVTRLDLVDQFRGPATFAPIRAPLRRVAFGRVDLGLWGLWKLGEPWGLGAPAPATPTGQAGSPGLEDRPEAWPRWWARSSPLLVGLRLAALAAEAVLAVDLPPPRLTEVSVPPRSLFWVGAPGVVTRTGGADVWRPVPTEPSRGDLPQPGAAFPLPVEVVARSRLLRSRAFASLAPYLYRPNLASTLALGGLAALTLVLAGRRGRRGEASA